MKSNHEPSSLENQLGDLTMNASTPQLYEHALKGEGLLAEHGALVVDTGKFTGRSPKDKFVVQDELTESTVDWGEVNQPISPEHFELLKQDMFAWVQGRRLYRQDLHVGQDERFQLPVRVYTQYAWHSLFARTMFVRDGSADDEADRWTVLDLPGFKASGRSRRRAAQEVQGLALGPCGTSQAPRSWPASPLHVWIGVAGVPRLSCPPRAGLRQPRPAGGASASALPSRAA